MSISIAALRAMAGAGATVEMIIAAVEAEQISDRVKGETRREKNAERMRVSRAQSRTSRTNAHIAHNQQELVFEMEDETQDVVQSTATADVDDAEQKEIPPTPPKEKIYTTRERARSGEHLRSDWMPEPADLEFAQSQLPDDQIQIEIAKFRDYWHARAGPGAVKRDWSATWRNWCRKAVEHHNERAKRTPEIRVINGGYHGRQQRDPRRSVTAAIDRQLQRAYEREGRDGS